MVFDSAYVYDILRRRCEGQPPQSKVFPISAETYRRWWQAAARTTGVADQIGPPYSARHAGASRDLTEGRRTFDELKRRGRWRTDKAVQRYARPHVWTAVQSAVPEIIKKKAEELLAQRR